MRGQLAAAVTALGAAAALSGCAAPWGSGSSDAAVTPAVHRHLRTAATPDVHRVLRIPAARPTHVAAPRPDLKARLTRAELTTHAARTALFDEQVTVRLTSAGQPPVGFSGARTLVRLAGEVDFSTSRYHSYHYEASDQDTDDGGDVLVAPGAPDRAELARLVNGTTTWFYVDPAATDEVDDTGPGGAPTDLVDVTSHINGPVLALGRAHLPGSQSTFLAYQTTVDYRQQLLDEGRHLTHRQYRALRDSHATEFVWVDSLGRIAQIQVRLGSPELAGLGYSPQDLTAFSAFYDTTTLRNWGAPFYQHVPTHQTTILSPTKTG